MKKMTALLIVIVLISAIVVTALAACAHNWIDTQEGYQVFDQHGASGHTARVRTYKWCTKCGKLSDPTGWKQVMNLTPHSYDNLGNKTLKSASRINNAQHIAYYSQAQQCYFCGYTRTLQTSNTESHTFSNGKCTKCGARK